MSLPSRKYSNRRVRTYGEIVVFVDDEIHWRMHEECDHFIGEKRISVRNGNENRFFAGVVVAERKRDRTIQGMREREREQVAHNPFQSRHVRVDLIECVHIPLADAMQFPRVHLILVHFNHFVDRGADGHPRLPQLQASTHHTPVVHYVFDYARCL